MASITISRGKRGLRLHARGGAAQGIFAAMTAVAPAPGPVAYTVHFEDYGQDFLEWDCDANHYVVACRPFQAWLWVGKRLLERPTLGGHVAYYRGGDFPSIRYPVTKVTEPPK